MISDDGFVRLMIAMHMQAEEFAEPVFERGHFGIPLSLGSAAFALMPGSQGFNSLHEPPP